MTESTCPSSSTDAAFTIALSNGLSFYGIDRRQLPAVRFLVNEIFRGNYYRKPGFELQSGDVIIDIGANMGIFALWAAPQVENGRIFCVEPGDAIETLEFNLRRNGITNVTPICCALASQCGQMEFLSYPDFNITNHNADFVPSAWGQFCINFLVGHRPAPAQRSSVPCRTLEALMDDYCLDQVDLLKIDCEGAEYDILESASHETLSRVRRICLEFHLFHPSHDYRRLATWLNASGFKVTTERTYVDRWVLKTGTLWAQRI